MASWPEWNADTEWVRLDGPFAAGSTGVLKPGGGPRVKFVIQTLVPDREFVDVSPGRSPPELRAPRESQRRRLERRGRDHHDHRTAQQAMGRDHAQGLAGRARRPTSTVSWRG